MNTSQRAVMLTNAELAGKSLLDVAEYTGSLISQTRAVARQRAEYILTGDDAPYKVLELLSQLETFVDRMNTRREWQAMSLIDATRVAVNYWSDSLDKLARMSGSDEGYADMENAANLNKLNAHSHLVHLGQRMPRSVRGDEKATDILRALSLITASTRHADVAYIPELGDAGKAGRAALERIETAERDAVARREASLARRNQRLLENAQATEAAK